MAVLVKGENDDQNGPFFRAVLSVFHSGLGIDQSDKKHRGRGRARHFENTGAGPGSEFFLLPGPGQGRDRNFFIAGTRVGPGSEFFLLPGPGPGRD